MRYRGVANSIKYRLMMRKAWNPVPTPHDPLCIQHLCYMVEQILENDKLWSDSKKGRWLGWAQAVACLHGLYTLAESKELNRQFSED